ncbi:MAG: hypothetical protein LBB14_03020, partial [Puniceicoccales bacterium]|nr:hypothetical protein [Puniceicoccales bacterium]
KWKVATVILSVVGKLGLTGGSVIISATLGALIGGHLVLGPGFWIAIAIGIVLFLLFGIGCEVAAEVLRS